MTSGTLGLSRKTWVIIALVAAGFAAFAFIEEAILDPRIGWHRAVLIDVDQRGDDVEFSFFMKSDRFWGDPRPPHPVWKLRVLEKTPSGRDDSPGVVWKIVLATGAKPATQVRYGVVPPGFTQEVPPRGAPPPLGHGRRYAITVNGYGPLAHGIALFETGEAGGRPYVRRVQP